MTRTHGLAHKHPLYERWKGMRARCNNPNHGSYARYGARGIRVCERWDDFEQFVRDVGVPPEGHELHRMDNDGDYEPDNVVWVFRPDHRVQPKSAEHREKIGAAHRGRKHSPEHAAASGRAHRAQVDPAQILRMRAEGMSLQAIGAELGLHYMTISRALNRFDEVDAG